MKTEAPYPDELLYHEAHDWVRIDGEEAEFGITWYAQNALGDVVHFEPPTVGDKIDANASYGELESVKTVSDVIAPLDGEVLAVNSDVVEAPEMVNNEPYEAWLVRVKVSDPDQASSLLSAKQYTDFLASS